MAKKTDADTADPADTADTAVADTEVLGYEEARAELVEVVRLLETGGTTLEESLALWERGEHLAGVCQSFIDGARERLDVVLEAGDPDPDSDD